MKLTIFDRQKHMESLRKLKLRKAPNYVLEAFRDGHISTLNEYYKTVLDRKRGKALSGVQTENSKTVEAIVEFFDLDILNEAMAVKDLDFIKAFFKMANLDLVSGNKLPPNAAHLIKQGIAKEFGLNILFKKLG